MLCDPPDQQHHQCPRLQPDTVGYGHTRCPDGSRPHCNTADTPRSHGAKAKPAETRLRRALLRQHKAVQYHLLQWKTGRLERCPGGAGPKIRWKGPATVVMTEPGRTGPATNKYWTTHGSTLLRVSGEHLPIAFALDQPGPAHTWFNGLWPLGCLDSAVETAFCSECAFGIKQFEKLRVATLNGRLPTSPGSLAHNRLSHTRPVRYETFLSNLRILRKTSNAALAALRHSHPFLTLAKRIGLEPKHVP